VNEGFCCVEPTVPSLWKSHAHDVGEPDDVSVKLTVSGALPDVALVVKEVCGVAIEVPLIVFVAVLESYQADVMLTPGAN
jgi:hypothetical protein